MNRLLHDVSLHREGSLPARSGSGTGVARAESMPSPDHAADTFSLQDAAEELEFSKAERRPRDLAERDIAHATDDPLDLPRLEKLMEAMADAGDDSELRQRALMLAKTAARSAVSLLGMLDASGDEPAVKYLLVKLAAAQAKGAEREEVLAKLKTTERQLLVRDGVAIRAALNTLAQASDFGPHGVDKAIFRAAYRDAVQAYGTLASAFKQLLSRFGADRFEIGCQLIMRGLANDLGSVEPSTQPLRLHAVYQDMFLLQAAAAALAYCKKLTLEMHRARRRRSQGRDDAHADETPYELPDPLELTTEIATLADDKDVSVATVVKLSERWKIYECRERVLLYSGVLTGLRSLPVKLFLDELKGRERVMQAAQRALDVAILEEAQL